MDDSPGFLNHIVALFALVIPVCSGTVLWSAVAASSQVHDRSLNALGACMSIGSAHAIHALCCQLLLALGLASTPSIIVTDLLLLASTIVTYFVIRRTTKPDGPQSTQTTFDWEQLSAAMAKLGQRPLARKVLVAASALTICCLTFFAALQTSISPLGDWDAWIIWNTKARLLYLTPDDWLERLRRLAWWQHADYPLGHPCSVARVWFWSGETQLAPILISLFHPVLTTLFVVSALTHLRSLPFGLAAGVILLASPVYQESIWAQCADGPLAFYIVAGSVGLLVARSMQNSVTWWLLCGLSAGIAANIKNEGIAWLAIFASLLLIDALFRRQWKPYLVWWLAAGPLLAMSLAFRMAIGVENDLFATERSLRDLLTDFDRHLEVFHSLGLALLGSVPEAAREANETSVAPSLGLGCLATLALFVILVSGKHAREQRPTLILLTIALLGYLAAIHIVFVTTPHNLDWHLFSAAHRVIAQIWPMLAFLTFAWVGGKPTDPERDA